MYHSFFVIELKFIYLHFQVAEFEAHVTQSSSNSVQFTFILSLDVVIQLQTISREIEWQKQEHETLAYGYARFSILPFYIFTATITYDPSNVTCFVIISGKCTRRLFTRFCVSFVFNDLFYQSLLNNMRYVIFRPHLQLCVDSR